MKIAVFTLISALPLIVAFYLLNIFLEGIILGDICQYHEGENSAVFKLFYDTPGWNGFHPWPTVFNLASTVFLPALLIGYRFAKRFFTYKEV